jgi:hypothetical protein
MLKISAWRWLAAYGSVAALYVLIENWPAEVTGHGSMINPASQHPAHARRV